MKDIIIEKTFENLDDFYKASSIVTNTGNKLKYYEIACENNADFLGLDLVEIKKSKYSYSKGLDNLKEIETDDWLTGNHVYKYDELDGDDINYDRLLDGFPALVKRIKSKNNGLNRIVNIHVNIAENCNVSYKDMLYKTYTTIRIIDMLENKGYRVGVYVCAISSYTGEYKSANVEKLDIRICIKKPEEPVIKPLLLTCISPWFFRYYIFCYYNSILDTNIGLGSAKKLSKISDTKDIYIDNGECLTYNLAKFKIESIKNLFNLEYESEHMLNAHS